MKEDLGATDIELGIGGILVSLVESKQLGPGKVVAALESVGNGDGEMAIVVDEFLGAPLAGSLIVTLVPDLEPSATGGGVSLGTVDFLEVGGARTLVGNVNAALACIVGPLSVLKGHSGATIDRADTSNTVHAVETSRARLVLS